HIIVNTPARYTSQHTERMIMGVEQHLVRLQQIGPDDEGTAVAGTVRISVCGRAVEHYAAMALMKRSPKITAN
ncbi:hypothetical protein, partial [Sphingobium fluviale]|uniref:hypothetical protein n=1 Tax=Sphingobium fluviale TaxID=2506423 RepID=UPI001C7054EF